MSRSRLNSCPEQSATLPPRRWLTALVTGVSATAVPLLAMADEAPAAAPTVPTAAPVAAEAAPTYPVPLQIDVGGFTGFTLFSEGSGLGNNPGIAATAGKVAIGAEGPGSGAIVGAHGGVVLMDGKLGLEAMLRNTFSGLRTSTVGANVFGVRAQGLWYFATEGAIRPFAMAGAGVDVLTASKPQCNPAKANPGDTCVNVVVPNTDWALNLGVGAKIPLSYRLALRAAAVYMPAKGLPGSGLASNFEFQLGAMYTIGGVHEDRDRDGIPDDWDKCALEAEDKDGFSDIDGCPDPDNDGDGLLDIADKCVSEPEDKDGFEDSDGCPDPDNDKDGILDIKDKCPGQPETKNGYQDDDGCPDVADSDGDGLRDDSDKCPKQGEDKDGFEDADGCPDPDNDKDGFLDAQDKCPMSPETKNGLTDDDGCPDQLPPTVQKLFEGPIALVEFKGDQINKGQEVALEALAAFLVDQDTVRIEVAVQPDADTDAAKASALARAEAIKAALGQQSGEGERVTTAVSAAAATPPKAVKGVSKPLVTLKLR